jgi:hypothetical protein
MEDIPGALEQYIEDMRKAGLSADKGVHFLFFIADAGFRNNENARVMKALNSLKDLGVIMVMCQLSQDSSLQKMVRRAQECFQDAGQYIKLKGVDQLGSIAASVTQSIQASLFRSGTVTSVTASVGSTIDTIRKVATLQDDHGSLKKTEDLVKLSVMGAEAVD